MSQSVITTNWQTYQTNMPQNCPRWLREPPSSAGLFGRLPREIREEIFKPVIAAGTTAITRTSKYLHADTEGFLASHGVFRTHLVRNGEGYSLTHPAPLYSPFPVIRHVDITVVLVTNNNYHICHTFGQGAMESAKIGLQRLLGGMMEHQSCYIRIVRETFCQFDSSELKGLEIVRGFETVTVELLSLRHVNWFRDMAVEDGYMTPSSPEELSEGFGRLRATLAVKGFLDSVAMRGLGQELNIEDTIYINEGSTKPYQYPPELFHVIDAMESDEEI